MRLEYRVPVQTLLIAVIVGVAYLALLGLGAKISLIDFDWKKPRRF